MTDTFSCCLRWCLAGFSCRGTISPFPHWSEMSHQVQLICKGRRVKLRLLEGEICAWVRWKSMRTICAFSSIYVFTQSFISAQTHEQLFYSLSYNPILSLFILLLRLFYLAIGSSFRLTPVSFDMSPSCFKQFFIFRHSKRLQALSVYSPPQPQKQPFL